MRATCPLPPHPPATSSLLGRKFFLLALFSNIRRLLSAFNMKDKILEACEAACLIIPDSDRSKEITVMKVVVITKVMT
jgi:hypothetical protein